MQELEQIIDLQCRFSELEDTLDQLNKVVAHQQQQIAELKQALITVSQDQNALKEQVAPEIINSLPPHY